ncbi:MAG: hypothetical protein KY461_13235 [Actinobacteria bacterium]|nr:hypothetical protein [Actinomycetota bacterium]
MTSTEERATPPAGAVLVRVFAHGLSWVRSLPVVPDGATVTATVSNPRLRRVPADDLVSHGYRVVGTSATRPRGAGDVVDLLVPRELRLAHEGWFRELLGLADRAFDCDLGPVRRLLGAELALHAAAAGPTPVGAPDDRRA